MRKIKWKPVHTNCRKQVAVQNSVTETISCAYDEWAGSGSPVTAIGL